nr:WhiB family transcriptional regulator [Angustibacter aerolatus]
MPPRESRPGVHRSSTTTGALQAADPVTRDPRPFCFLQSNRHADRRTRPGRHDAHQAPRRRPAPPDPADPPDRSDPPDTDPPDGGDRRAGSPHSSSRPSTSAPGSTPSPAGRTTRSSGSPSRPPTSRLAKALCSDCPVRAACLAGALERREPWGVWGGRCSSRAPSWRASGRAAGLASARSPHDRPAAHRRPDRTDRDGHHHLVRRASTRPADHHQEHADVTPHARGPGPGAGSSAGCSRPSRHDWRPTSSVSPAPGARPPRPVARPSRPSLRVRLLVG